MEGDLVVYSIDEIRKITKAATQKQDTWMHTVFEQHKKFIEKEIERCAKNGQYFCYSLPVKYSFINKIPSEENIVKLHQYLRNKLTKYFEDAWEYTVAETDDGNRFIISWFEKEDKERING